MLTRVIRSSSLLKQHSDSFNLANLREILLFILGEIIGFGLFIANLLIQLPNLGFKQLNL